MEQNSATSNNHIENPKEVNVKDNNQKTSYGLRERIKELEKENAEDGKRYEGLVSHARFLIIRDFLYPFLDNMELDFNKAKGLAEIKSSHSDSVAHGQTGTINSLEVPKKEKNGYFDLLESTRTRFENRYERIVQKLKGLQEEFDKEGNLVGGLMHHSNELSEKSELLKEEKEEIANRKGLGKSTRSYTKIRTNIDQHAKECSEYEEKRNEFAEKIANELYEGLFSKIVDAIDNAYQQHKGQFELGKDIKAIPLDELPPGDSLEEHNKLLEEIKDKIIRNDLNFVKIRHPLQRGDSYGQKVEHIYDLLNKTQDWFRHKVRNPETIKNELIKSKGIDYVESKTAKQDHSVYTTLFSNIEKCLHNLEKEISDYGRKQRQPLSNLGNEEALSRVCSSSENDCNKVRKALNGLSVAIYSFNRTFARPNQQNILGEVAK